MIVFLRQIYDGFIEDITHIIIVNFEKSLLGICYLNDSKVKLTSRNRFVITEE